MSATNDIDLIASVLSDWWYYTVELAPGKVATGQYSPRTPMLPRMLMRNCNLRGQACLDIGSMEGLMPMLMARQGARKVLATDAVPHCLKKMSAVQRLYGVGFEFQQVGLIYDLAAKLAGHGGFDFINLSGVLYHVFSPLHVLAGVRPLLKKGGLMIVATNVMRRNDYAAEFNHQGRLQTELNTFWYPSIPLLESWIRTFQMVPIDFIYMPHTEVNPANYVPGLDSGYLAVVCRAVEAPQYPDPWTASMRDASWETMALCNQAMLKGQAESTISYLGNGARNDLEEDTKGIVIWDHIHDPGRSVASVDDPRNSHVFHLADAF
jgi:SAM-dependent methyltransferase